MKILLVHPHDIFSANEPWTVRIVSLAKEFKVMGHEVKLAYCPLGIPQENIHRDLNGISLIKLSRKAGIANLFSNIKKMKEVAEWADIIHLQKCFHYVSVPVVVCAILLNRPLHYDWDDWEEKIWYHSNKMSLHTFIFGHFIRILERLLPVIADTVSVASKKLEDLCVEFGVDKTRISRAPVGADLSKFNPSVSGAEIKKRHYIGDKNVVLYIGQLHGGQYVNMFIEAANVVLHKHADTVFLIVGQGFMLNQLKEFARGLGIERRIIFTGSVAHDEIPEYIGASDVCVASFQENEVTLCKSPLKLAEYLACGKPIVASLVGEVRNMVGGAGLAVEPGNYLALSQAITAFLGNNRLRQEAGVRARERAEARYNWASTARNIIAAYEQTVLGKVSKRSQGNTNN